MSNEAVRGIHLGRAANQSGYLVYDPETKRMHVPINCRCVETAFPGLTLHRDGWAQVIPDYSDEFDACAERRMDAEFEETVEKTLTGEPQSDPLVEQDEAPDEPDDMPAPHVAAPAPPQGGA